MAGARFGKNFFVGSHIIGPFTAGEEVGLIKFPIFGWRIKALLEALLLGITIDVKEEFNNNGILVA